MSKLMVAVIGISKIIISLGMLLSVFSNAQSFDDIKNQEQMNEYICNVLNKSDIKNISNEEREFGTKLINFKAEKTEIDCTLLYHIEIDEEVMNEYIYKNSAMTKRKIVYVFTQLEGRVAIQLHWENQFRNLLGNTYDGIKNTDKLPIGINDLKGRGVLNLNVRYQVKMKHGTYEDFDFEFKF